MPSKGRNNNLVLHYLFTAVRTGEVVGLLLGADKSREHTDSGWCPTS